MKVTTKAAIIYANILVIFSCLIMASCTNNTAYHHYIPIKTELWCKTDTLYFTLPDSMPSGYYNSRIGIRHTVDYPYRDLWLSVHFPGNEKADTVHLYLVNERGNWNSNGTASGYYQYETDCTNFHYEHSADSVIKVSHIMEDFYLKAITDVGIKITE